MSSVAFDRETKGHVKRLERSMMRNTGKKLPDVRDDLAFKLGTLPGTLENLARGRIKGVRSWLKTRIEALVIQEIGAEIGRLEAERAALLGSGHHLAGEQVCEVEAHLAAAKAILRFEP